MRKLISFVIELDKQNNVNVSLLKECDRYLVKTEYYQLDDKVKETNNEVSHDLVYHLFYALETVEFVDFDNNDCLASLKVYYSQQDYLEQEITKELLNKSDELRDVVNCLVGFIDERIDQSFFAIDQLN